MPAKLLVQSSLLPHIWFARAEGGGSGIYTTPFFTSLSASIVEQKQIQCGKETAANTIILDVFLPSNLICDKAAKFLRKCRPFYQKWVNVLNEVQVVRINGSKHMNLITFKRFYCTRLSILILESVVTFKNSSLNSTHSECYLLYYASISFLFQINSN